MGKRNKRIDKQREIKDTRYWEGDESEWDLYC